MFRSTFVPKETFESDITKRATQKSLDILVKRVENLAEMVEKEVKNVILGKPDLIY